MDEDDLSFLNKSINNENNKNITNKTFKDINDEKVDVLKNLNISKKDTNNLIKKLKDYQYIDEFQELIQGRYIRYINLLNPNNIKLSNGGLLCEIKIEDYVALVLKNNLNKFFQINLDENLIFQKLSDQEKIILYALDVIS
tara:strand:- start:14967 stop:15389 length:423 start_codon:yes stop_codon:yes gene_type:complete